tara:strand:+ start:1200 stop:2111 length:912 start_codon:yes stop_codon:yes gene_type:complete
MKNKFIRSPFFYVGDKYKLLPEITKFFPKQIDKFIEPFMGGGSVYLNIDAKSYLLNDLDKHLIKLHKLLFSYRDKPESFFKEIFSIIDLYKLSKSYEKDIVPLNLKKKFPKTYYAHFNKENYTKLKLDFNNETSFDYHKAYVLLIYGFNRILRFNLSGKFNLPVGNVDFNKNVVNSLNNYFQINQKKKVKFSSLDYKDFLKKISISKNDFVYFDPPYLITAGEYNKYWSKENELDLLEFLDSLNKSNIRWVLSNVIEYRGKNNSILKSWMKKYNVNRVKSNYISFNDNSIKSFKEVLIRNFNG